MALNANIAAYGHGQAHFPPSSNAAAAQASTTTINNHIIGVVHVHSPPITRNSNVGAPTDLLVDPPVDDSTQDWDYNSEYEADDDTDDGPDDDPELEVPLVPNQNWAWTVGQPFPAFQKIPTNDINRLRRDFGIFPNGKLMLWFPRRTPLWDFRLRLANYIRSRQQSSA